MSADVGAWFTAVPGGVRVAVRLTPRASRDAIEGFSILAGGRGVLMARVRAVPAAGEANDALIRLLAEALHLPRSRLALAEGATSRIKVVHVAGDPAVLAASLDALSQARAASPAGSAGAGRRA